jgi:raffinose/stachyose/melibiose transport system substrate-binding protein
MRKMAVLMTLVAGICISTSAVFAAPVKLELYYYKQEAFIEGIKAIVSEYEKSNPDVKFELTMVPDGWTVLKTRMAGGKAPDIIQLQSYSQVFEFAGAGYLVDLTKDPVLSKVIPSAKGAVTYNGKAYAVPMDYAGIGIIYNKELFRKAGIKKAPATFKELQDACAKLKKANILPFAGLLKANWSSGHFITLVHTTLLGAKGGNKAILSWIQEMNKGKGSFGGPVKKSDLFRIMDFYRANMSDNATEWDWNEQQKAFASGEAAMMVQGLWSYGAAIGTNPKLDCGFIPFPCTNNPKDTKFYADVDSTFAISAQSTPDKQAAAKKFLNWLSTPKAIKLWTTKCKLTVAFKGADLSGLPSPFQQLMSGAAKGAYPWAFSMYPTAAFEDAAKNGAQQYFFKRLNADQVIARIDDIWKKNIGK